jgi:uncharacterized HAD superfamily protein
VNIGLDLDGTITRNKEFFSWLSNLFIRAGHKVFIITYRDKSLREETTVWLRENNIGYNNLICCPDWNEIEVSRWKANMASDLNLDVMFEDDPKNLQAMDKHILKLLVCPGEF